MIIAGAASLTVLLSSKRNREINCLTADRVARTAELDQLVALVAAAAQSVEHRVDHDIEHAHREAGHERAQHVYAERLDITREELYAHADEADRDGRQRGKLVTLAFEDYTGRNTHAGISDEVGQCAQLRKRVARMELVLYDDAHRSREIGDEGDHEKQCEHHDDGQRVIFLFGFHKFIIIC